MIQEDIQEHHRPGGAQAPLADEDHPLGRGDRLGVEAPAIVLEHKKAQGNGMECLQGRVLPRVVPIRSHLRKQKRRERKSIQDFVWHLR